MDSLFAIMDPGAATWLAGSIVTVGSALVGALAAVLFKGLSLVRWAIRLLLNLLEQQTEIQRTFAEQINAIERRQSVIEQQVERVVVSLEGHVREHRSVDGCVVRTEVGQREA